MPDIVAGTVIQTIKQEHCCITTPQVITQSYAPPGSTPIAQYQQS